MSVLDTGARLLGGIGLFLLGMSLMSEGLRLAAGGALRDILARSTRTRLRGLGAGVLVTALVQSSSAVTVAVIGFVNAGLLPLEQAVWVVFGSNVGTTMTGWLVALIGFKLKIEAFALPLVGIGMILKLTGAGTRRESWGLAVIGFGLLFLGIETLKQAFASLGVGVTLPAMAGAGVLVMLAYLGIGVVLTTLMQSSSAALVVALTAAEGGMIPLGAAAAVVIGANVGTTSTALISVWGATAAAKRVAMAHVAFNVLTGIIALALLYPMLEVVAWLQARLDITRSPAMTLAVFHSLFNCLGVALMGGLGGPLVRWLKTRFRRADEDAARPRFLDRSVLSVPQLALEALDRELARVRDRTASLLRDVFSPGAREAPRVPHAEVVVALVDACRAFAAELGRAALPPAVAVALPDRLRAAQHYADAARAAGSVAAAGRLSGPEAELASLERALDEQVDAVAGVVSGRDEAMLTEAAGRVQEAYAALKAALLRAGAAARLPVGDMDRALERARLARFAAERMVKAARRMRPPEARSAAEEEAGGAEDSET